MNAQEQLQAAVTRYIVTELYKSGKTVDEIGELLTGDARGLWNAPIWGAIRVIVDKYGVKKS